MQSHEASGPPYLSLPQGTPDNSVQKERDDEVSHVFAAATLKAIVDYFYCNTNWDSCR